MSVIPELLHLFLCHLITLQDQGLQAVPQHATAAIVVVVVSIYIVLIIVTIHQQPGSRELCSQVLDQHFNLLRAELEQHARGLFGVP